jgi:hypothetical protein
MDTSIGARYVVIALIFAAACAVVYANFRVLAFLALRRKVGLVSKLVWPALLLALVFAIIDATRIEPNWVQVTHRTVKTAKLPVGSHFRIVQLADIHLDRFGVHEIQMMNLTARQRPDLIVLTGDHTVEKSPRAMHYLTQIAVRLSRLAPVYAIEGNWDIPDDMAALEAGGAKTLTGWTVFHGQGGARVALGCVPWDRQGECAPPRKIQRLYTVALCHVPDRFPEVARERIDLMLAGHTHGGQVRLPLFGALLPDWRLVGKYQAGMYSIRTSRLYVSRGIGMEGGAAPNVRFWCRPEVAVIDIVGKADR